jgi:peptidoglycan/LPS O-acetylase OafA/YrhL
LHPAAVAGAACLLTRALFALGVRDEWKPIVHLADFLMGIAAASLYDRVARARRQPAGYWLYVPGAVAGAALIAFPELLPSGVDLNSAWRPLSAMLLLGFALGSGVVARALSTRPAVFLGKSSYAMYILHVPVLWWMRRWSLDLSAALYVAVVILISAAVYRFLEEPANRFIRSLA